MTATWERKGRVDIDKVEPALRTLWSSAGPQGQPVTRVQHMTLVAVCETPDHQKVADAALSSVGGAHGARTIVITTREGGARPSIVADVALHPRAARPELPGGEQVHLEALGGARGWIPDTLSKLLASDLPIYVWWVGDLPDDDELFDRVAPLSKLAIFNSNDMDLRDLSTLDRLAAGEDHRYALADFAWHRLRTWQDLVARFFDDPGCAAELSSLTEVIISFRVRRDPSRSKDPISNQAALFAGWWMHALSLELSSWSTSGEPTATLTRAGAGKGAVTLRFRPIDRGDLPTGAIDSIELKSPSSSYHVGRDEKDPFVVCWAGEHPKNPIPKQCVRIHFPDEARMLGYVLEHPIRDPLFEASLHTAATLVSSIAPSAPKGGAT